MAIPGLELEQLHASQAHSLCASSKVQDCLHFLFVSKREIPATGLHLGLQSTGIFSTQDRTGKEKQKSGGKFAFHPNWHRRPRTGFHTPPCLDCLRPSEQWQPATSQRLEMTRPVCPRTPQGKQCPKRFWRARHSYRNKNSVCHYPKQSTLSLRVNHRPMALVKGVSGATPTPATGDGHFLCWPRPSLLANEGNDHPACQIG